jgi:hypothetical protein
MYYVLHTYQFSQISTYMYSLRSYKPPLLTQSITSHTDLLLQTEKFRLRKQKLLNFTNEVQLAWPTQIHLLYKNKRKCLFITLPQFKLLGLLFTMTYLEHQVCGEQQNLFYSHTSVGAFSSNTTTH